MVVDGSPPPPQALSQSAAINKVTRDAGFAGNCMVQALLLLCADGEAAEPSHCVSRFRHIEPNHFRHMKDKARFDS